MTESKIEAKRRVPRGDLKGIEIEAKRPVSGCSGSSPSQIWLKVKTALSHPDAIAAAIAGGRPRR